MGWAMRGVGDGYRRIDGAVSDLYVAITDEVAEVGGGELGRGACVGRGV
jgi:hypothetical protein